MELTHVSEPVRRLVELRDEQRILLAAVPDLYFKDARWSRPAPACPSGTTPEAPELYIREKAANALTADARAYLANRTSQVCARWVRDADDLLRSDTEFRFGYELGIDDDLNRQFSRDAAHAGTLLAFMYLAVMADEVAGAGGRQTRVQRPEGDPMTHS